MTLNPLIYGAADLTRQVLAEAPEPTQDAICRALNHGAQVACMVKVLPRPALALVLIEPEGRVLTLLEIEIKQSCKH